MLWLRLGFSSLPPCFPPSTFPAVPSGLPQLFSLLRLWPLIPVFIPVFLILLLRCGAPLVVIRAAGSPFTVPWLSGCCFPCVSTHFLLQGFPRLLCLSLLCSSGCILSLGVCSPLCLFVVFFAPTSVLPPPVCLALFSVTCWFSGASDLFGSPVPVATWSPFGTSQGCYGICFLSFEMPACDGILSVFVSAPFLSLVRIWSSLRDVLAGGLHLGCFGALSGSISSSFLRRFLCLLVRVAFALLLALPWCLSAVPDFGLCFLVGSTLFCGCPFVSSFQFMVLSSFVGHSSSVPSPLLPLGASGSFYFAL